MKRSGVNKYQSAKKFRRSVGKTKVVNVKASQRGGIRM